MRIALASFQHETNTFSPQLTQYHDFLQADGWPGMLVGQQVCDQLAGLNIASEGFIQEAIRSDHSIVPISWCSAEPAGKVTDDAFETIMAQLLQGLSAAENIDALFLDLHGAMVSQTYQDGEAEILSRIRDLLGSAFPIVASLDFHANVGQAFINDIDALAIYRTYPHLDMAATGARCVALLEQQQSGALAFKAFRQIPYLIPLSSQHTGSAPNIELFSQLALLEKTSGINNIEFAMGFPPADIKDSGASISVFGTDQAIVDEVCQRFHDIVMQAEHLFEDNLLTTEQALAIARDVPDNCPVVIADVQDNPGAGGSADTTGVLSDLVSGNARNAVIAALCDEDAVKAAHAAGVSAKLSLSLGGHSGLEELGSFTAQFEVLALGDGAFTCTGEMYAGCKVELGKVALLKVSSDDCDVKIIVTSLRYACTDLAIYQHLGIDPTNVKLLIVKSTVHYRAAFEPISQHILMVESPGLHPCRLASLDYKNLRKNVRLGPKGPLYLGGV